METKDIFVDRLNKVKTDLKIKDTNIADHLGITNQAVGKYFNGKSVPDFDKLVKISQFLNVSVDFLLGNDTFDKLNNPNLSLKIKEIRISKGLTQKEFADLTDLPLLEIEEIENGKKPSIDTLIKISTFMQVNLDYLIKEIENDIIADAEYKRILKFVMEEENRDYIRLAMAIKEKGIKPEEAIIPVKFDISRNK